MKKSLLVPFVLAFSIRLSAQAIIENPAQPPNPKAGRIVTIKEELRIADTGEGYYFKNPRLIQIATDGSIFIQDEQNQLLRFNPQGRFAGNLLKIGQGPGEMTALLSFLVTAEDIILFGNPPKIIHMDHQGQIKKELSVLKATMSHQLLGYRDGVYIFRRTDRPQFDSGSKWIDHPQILVALSDGGKTSADLASFPIRSYAAVQGGRAYSLTSFVSLLIVPFGETQYVLSHTPEYLVKIFDAGKKEVLRQFRREYKRVKRPSGGGGVRGTGGPGPEPPEFANDIVKLHTRGDRILVQTSTINRKKGVLFDVFDSEGNYIDAFYLKSSEKNLEPYEIYKQFTFVGGSVFFTESTDEGLIVIKKCSLVGY